MRLDRSRVALAFGATLRIARHRRGISQEKLAEACDMDRTYPSLLERGQRTPTLTVILDLAAALDIPAERLIIETNNRIDDG